MLRYTLNYSWKTRCGGEGPWMGKQKPQGKLSQGTLLHVSISRYSYPCRSARNTSPLYTVMTWYWGSQQGDCRFHTAVSSAPISTKSSWRSNDRVWFYNITIGTFASWKRNICYYMVVKPGRLGLYGLLPARIYLAIMVPWNTPVDGTLIHIFSTGLSTFVWMVKSWLQRYVDGNVTSFKLIWILIKPEKRPVYGHVEALTRHDGCQRFALALLLPTRISGEKTILALQICL